MKRRICALLIALAAQAFAVDANKPRVAIYEPTPLTDQINQYIWFDQAYAGFLHEQCSWFDGEIMAYRVALDFVGPYGMRFTTDPSFQVWEEQYLLRFVTQAWLFQQYAKTPGAYAYYGGAINAYYRVLAVMNRWGAYGAPVPGTFLLDSPAADVEPLATQPGEQVDRPQRPESSVESSAGRNSE